MKHYRIFVLIFALSLAVALQPVSANDFDQPVMHPDIPLVDEDGNHVLNSGKPYSTRMSCGNGDGGGCHDIDRIAKAYHFEMGRDESEDLFGAFRGIPQLVSPGYFGGYNCMLKSNPQWLSKKVNSEAGEFLDYGAPGLIKACGECHNGGGFAEIDRDGIRYLNKRSQTIEPHDGDYYEWLTGDKTNAAGNQLALWDWQKSGVVEPDCLICHLDFGALKVHPESGLPGNSSTLPAYKKLRTEKLLREGLFRYVNTSILEFLNFGQEASGLKNLVSFDKQPSGQDYSLAVNARNEPKLTWNADAFDENKKLAIPMLRFPGNDNCMFCHHTSHERRGFFGLGPETEVKYDNEGHWLPDSSSDVHYGKPWTEGQETRVIQNCNVCHSLQYFKEGFRNVDLDADHNFPIGNSDEDVRRDLNFKPGPLSCEYCHVGPGRGGAPNPALPITGSDDILEAHKQIWADKGFMTGYAVSTYNRVVGVHFDIVGCQACHIVDLAYNGEPIELRYRYREAEDGRVKYMPYIPAARYYWIDKTNDRIISRRERFEVTGDHVHEPSSYDEVMQLKTQFDQLLAGKGYKNPDSRMVWTESNEYLVTHNTRPSAAAMPCGDCHDKRANGSYSSAIKTNSVIGSGRVRTVAQLGQSDGYKRLVDEGIVILDMPYHEVTNDGRIVERASDILFETFADPFTSVLRATSQDITSGRFNREAKSAIPALMGLPANDRALDFIGNQAFLFSNRIAGRAVKNVSVLIDLTASNRILVPEFQLEIAADRWTNMHRDRQAKRRNNARLGGATVASSAFNFLLTDGNKNPARAIGGNPMLIKLPYEGSQTDVCGIQIFESRIVGSVDGRLRVARPRVSKAYRGIVSVRSGTPARPGYVTVLFNELPDMVIVAERKKRTKKCTPI